MSLAWEECKLKRDSQGAYCLNCERLFCDLVPWHYSKSKFMHESNTGHAVIWVRLTEVSEHVQV